MKRLQGRDHSYTYSEKDLIDTGKYSKVYRSQDQNAEALAIKIIPEKFLYQHQAQIVEQLQQDLRKSINNPNVIQIQEIISENENLYIVMEYCDSGNLRKLLENYQLQEDKALFLFKQIMDGIKGFNDEKIFDKILKLENILLHNNKVVKIRYPGSLDQLMPKDQQENSQLGLLITMGVILYQMLYGILSEQKIVQVLNKNQNYIIFDGNPSVSVSEEIQNLIRQMLNQGLTFAQIYQNPKFQNSKKQLLSSSNLQGNLVESFEQQQQLSNMFQSSLQQDLIMNEQFDSKSQLQQPEQQYQQYQQQQQDLQIKQNENQRPPESIENFEPPEDEIEPVQNVNQIQKNKYETPRPSHDSSDEKNEQIAQIDQLIQKYQIRFNKIKYLLDSLDEISFIEFPDKFQMLYPPVIIYKKAMVEFEIQYIQLQDQATNIFRSSSELEKAENGQDLKQLIKKFGEKVQFMSNWFQEYYQPQIDKNLIFIRPFLQRTWLKEYQLKPSEFSNENYRQAVELILKLIQTMKQNTVEIELKKLINFESRLKRCLDFERLLQEQMYEAMEFGA